MRKITCTSRLTSREAEQLARLTQRCKSADGITLSCPLDGDMFCLLAEGEELLGALAVFFQENVWECYAFTCPDRRQQGCFTLLLERLEAEALALDAEPEFCFITDGNCPGALKTLETLGAEFWYAEHAMVWEYPAGGGQGGPWEMTGQGRPGGGNGETPGQGRPGTGNGETPGQGRERLVRLETASSQPGALLVTALDSDGRLVGTCGIYRQGSSACLFDVEVPEPRRRQGWGYAMISALLGRLPSLGVSRLSLQVSGSKTPAISLYQKTGFRITETLSYYLY